MEWYYAGGDKPVGPISEAQFDQLVRAGTIRPETLVWNAGMADWLPLQTVRKTSAPRQPAPPNHLPGGAPPVMEAMPCAECRQAFPTNEMIQLGGTWVCARCKPIFLQRIIEGAPQPTSELVWRSGKSLVATSGVDLPCRCARCNGPVSKPPIRRKLYWHQQWIYLLIALSVLIYIIVALIVRKKAVTAIPLCNQHRQQRWMIIAASWLMVLTGIVAIVAGVGARSGGEVALAGLALFVAGIVLGVWKGRLAVAMKIEGDKVWINGFCRDYLAGLPEWRG